jgi:hypothetical protein
MTSPVPNSNIKSYATQVDEVLQAYDDVNVLRPAKKPAAKAKRSLKKKARKKKIPKLSPGVPALYVVQSDSPADIRPKARKRRRRKRRVNGNLKARAPLEKSRAEPLGQFKRKRLVPIEA